MQNNALDENFVIATPEQISFNYEIAGIGSRFMAALIDNLLITLVLVVIYISALLLGLTALLSSASSQNPDAGNAGAFFVIALLVLITFLFTTGYFLLFEIVWRGQTPGKRLYKLRVIKVNGQPIGAGEAVVRNLVRIIDQLPSFYAIGIITMFIDKDVRRLGDLAAGTIVVRESEPVRLRDIRVAPPVQEAMQPVVSGYAPSSVLGNGAPNEPLATAQTYASEPARFDPLPGVSLREVTPEDYRLIREMLERTRRGEINSGRSQELATRLAYGVASRMGYDFREWQGRGWEPLVFLESVLNARDARG